MKKNVKRKALEAVAPLEQGSLEWHEHREKHANASEAPAVMGAGRFQPRNKRELCMVRNGAITKTSNFAMRVGSANEASVLQYLRGALKLPGLKPEVLTAIIDGIPMSASLDGRDGTSFAEVKTCVSETSPYWTEAKAGRIEESVLWQMTHQYIVCREHGAVDGHLCVEYNGERIIIPYEHDEAREEKLLAAWAEVWPHILAGTVVGDRADADWEAAAAEYKLLHEQHAAIKTKLEDAKDKLVKLSGGTPTAGNGVELKRMTRAGSVDYSSLPADVVAKLPRKPSTDYWQVNIIDEEKT